MDAIILAAGNGIRTSLDYPKQFYPVNGKPCLALSLELFENIDEISKIIITYNEQVKDKYQKLIEDFRITKAVLVEGGETRQKSVFNALQHVTSDKVLIHEAARPLISKDFVMRILSYENEVAVVPTLPVPFTVLEGADYMEKVLDRKRLHNIQLPQLFNTKILKEAHERAEDDNFLATEDSMIVFHYGNKVRFIPGSESNIKITTPLDLLIVNQIVNGERDV